MNLSNNNYSNRSFVRLSNTERIILLVIGDLIASFLALLLSLYIWSYFDAWLNFSLEFLTARTPNWFYLIPLIWSLLLIELYDVRRAAKKQATVVAVFLAAIVAFFLYLIIYFSVDPSNPLPRISVAFFIPIASLFTLAWRIVYIKLFTTSLFRRRVLIVGAGSAGNTITEIIRKASPQPFELIGLIDDDPEKKNQEILGVKIIGNRNQIMDLIEEYKITDIICAITYDIKDELLKILLQAEETGIQISTMPFIYEELLGRIPIEHLDNDWLLKTFLDQAHASESYGIFKRLVDIFISLIGLIPFLITCPLISLAVAIDSKGPVFLKQERLGKNGTPYTLLKYRTMADSASKGKMEPTAKHDSRITKVGHLLRKSHLDELPQVLLILSGKMSVVGPRSEITPFVKHFEQTIPFYRARFLAKPGLTGWAQVHQSYAATTEETTEKLEYDLYYIKHRTFLLDIHIIIRTIGQVLGFRGR